MSRLKLKLLLGKIAVLAVGCMLSVSVAQATVPDFTFIQISDEHSHVGPATAATIADLSQISSVLLEPYGVTALPPSFVIETGDMTEFGPKGDNWDYLNKCYSSCKLQRYCVLGNHDGAWRSLTPEMTKLYGAPYYSFDKFNCHFVILDSAGLQDPRPVLSPEELDWLKADLQKVGPDRPVFVALHHPLDCSEFSSVYEEDRLADILHSYNIALVLVGHGHSAIYSKCDGFDMVEGGSAYGPNKPGYQVISILDGKLRVAFKDAGSANAVHRIVEKPLAPPATRYPKISIQLPALRESCSTNIPVKVWVGLEPGKVDSAYAEIDGSLKIDLIQKSQGSFEAEINPAKLQSGAHYIKVFFKTKDGSSYHNSSSFYTDHLVPRVLWRADIGAASKSSPVVAGNTVCVGTNNGFLQALDIQSGKLQWKFKTGGAVTCEPLALNGKIYFSSEDGYLYCVSGATGKLIWKFNAGSPIFSSPVSDGAAVYVGASNGAFYNISVSTGKLNWENRSATYNIEVKPFISDGMIYFGCWDTYVYCLNTSDGSLMWKCVGQGSSEGTAPAYYSPADCGPVVCNGKVYAADRKFKLSIIDSSTGKLERYVDSVSAVGLSKDLSYAYIRKTDGNLAKIDDSGKEVWTASVSMDQMPAAPVDAGDTVYACSKNGLVSAVSSADGKVLWQYRATPYSFVLSSPGLSSKCLFVAGTDGVLTAFNR